MRPCVICSTPLIGKQQRYCSRTCGSKAFSTARKADGRLKAQHRKHAAERAKWQRDNSDRYLETRTCTLCGAEYQCLKYFAKQAFCSVSCAQQARTDRPPRKVKTQRVWIQGACAWCGDGFTTTHVSTYCTRRCKIRAKVARRAARYGEFDIAPTIRLAIYTRDDWTCQLCHEPVAHDLHYLDDWAPSLDHIECQSWTLIPNHSPENLRMAHRICNSRRGNRGLLAA